MACSARLSSSPDRAAALGVIDLLADTANDLDSALRSIGVRTLPVGASRLADLAGVDRGLAIRWTETFAQLTPHGGTAVVRALLDTLTERGIPLAVAYPAPNAMYPEARSDIEARALAALSRAPSPLAVDLLLAQHDRWRAHEGEQSPDPSPRDRRLMRLIDPPLVVVMGPPNVGKSTLLNALAGRELALTSDEPGTTRDHVGAMVEVGGLVVRWADAPGVRESAGVEAGAIRIARDLAHSADLLIGAGDAASLDPRSVLDREPDLTIALRSDLGTPSWTHDLALSALDEGDLGACARLIREKLVPEADLASEAPWKFWDH